MNPRASRAPGATEPAARRSAPVPAATPTAGPSPAAATPASALARLQRPVGASAVLAGADAPGFEALARQPLGEFRDAVARAGVPAARHAELAARCADALLAHVDLADVRIDNRFPAYQGSDDERAVPALVAVPADLRGRAAARLAAGGPAVFAAEPWMVAANATRRPGASAFQVLKAADLGDVLVDAFVTSIDPAQLHQVVLAIYAVGGSEADGAHLFAAASGIGARLGTAFLADEAARADVFAAIEALRE